ncbi:MAG: polymorphic toxin-type HINT domain-containing protein, partial [Verrucomicrobiales bacterium]
TYDGAARLLTETVNAPGEPEKVTTYSYDDADNRTAKTVAEGAVIQTAATYEFSAANQILFWTEVDGSGSALREAAFAYDDRGNRISQVITPAGGAAETTTYEWDYYNRLQNVTVPGGAQHAYAYDYRTRRIGRTEPTGSTAVSWSGGLSLAEYTVSAISAAVGDPTSPEVEYRRGPDMGGGIGGLLHSLRDGVPKYNLGNGRGDIVAQSDQAGALTWTASYEAFGTRPEETGTNDDRQRANSKEEDPTGLLWEHFRYRDLDSGVWLSRDPAGFVDGPNLYAYVNQNPWTSFDPLGLEERSVSLFQILAPATYSGTGNAPWSGSLKGDINFYNTSTNPKLQVAAGTVIAYTGVMGALHGGVAALGTTGTIAVGKEILDEGIDTAAEAAGVTLPPTGLVDAAQLAGKKLLKNGDKIEETARDLVNTSGKCFPAGTLVLTPAGQVGIEEINEGKVVLAYDEETGMVVPREVTKLVRGETLYWVEIDCGTETITATRGHRFWVESRGDWIAAIELKPGMTLREDDGEIRTVAKTKLRELTNPEATFNLEVAEEHNYFVGRSGILVHNGDTDEKDFVPVKGRDTGPDQSQRAAMREAKRRSGIPTSQTHTTHRNPMDKQIPGKTVTEFDFEVPKDGGGTETKTIPDHMNGHPKGNVPPHFNDTEGGHHLYEKKC